MFQPIGELEGLLIEMTNTFVGCQTTNFAKQLNTRFTTWKGLIEVGTTVGMAFVKQATDNGSSDFYNSMATWWNSEDCETSSNSFGTILSYMTNTETSDYVYYGDLVYYVADNMPDLLPGGGR